MTILKISLFRNLYYFIINILQTIFFIAATAVFWYVEHSISIFVVILVTIIYLSLAFYSLAFIVYFYLYDRSVEIHINEYSNDITYLDKNDIEIVFNINEIDKINICFPFIRVSLNYYNKIYLKSGQIVVVSCLLPIRKLKKKRKDRNAKLEHTLWINDFISKKNNLD